MSSIRILRLVLLWLLPASADIYAFGQSFADIRALTSEHQNELWRIDCRLKQTMQLLLLLDTMMRVLTYKTHGTKTATSNINTMMQNRQQCMKCLLDRLLRFLPVIRHASTTLNRLSINCINDLHHNDDTMSNGRQVLAINVLRTQVEIHRTNLTQQRFTIQQIWDGVCKLHLHAQRDHDQIIYDTRQLLQTSTEVRISLCLEAKQLLIAARHINIVSREAIRRSDTAF